MSTVKNIEWHTYSPGILMALSGLNTLSTRMELTTVGRISLSKPYDVHLHKRKVNIHSIAARSFLTHAHVQYLNNSMCMDISMHKLYASMHTTFNNRFRNGFHKISAVLEHLLCQCPSYLLLHVCMHKLYTSMHTLLNNWFRNGFHKIKAVSEHLLHHSVLHTYSWACAPLSSL